MPFLIVLFLQFWKVQIHETVYQNVGKMYLIVTEWQMLKFCFYRNALVVYWIIKCLGMLPFQTQNYRLSSYVCWLAICQCHGPRRMNREKSVVIEMNSQNNGQLKEQ